MNNLVDEHCQPLSKGSRPLDDNEITTLCQLISGWSLQSGNKSISRHFKFNSYYENMAFVNAVAWIAHIQDHHPEINITCNQCHVIYSTHSIDGLSRNDFICASKINALTS